MRTASPPSIALEGAGNGPLVTRGLGSRRFRIVVTGPGGHSWSDAGTPNPIFVLSRALAALSELDASPAPRAPRSTSARSREGPRSTPSRRSPPRCSISAPPIPTSCWRPSSRCAASSTQSTENSSVPAARPRRCARSARANLPRTHRRPPRGRAPGRRRHPAYGARRRSPPEPAHRAAHRLDRRQSSALAGYSGHRARSRAAPAAAFTPCRSGTTRPAARPRFAASCLPCSIRCSRPTPAPDREDAAVSNHRTHR